MDIVKENDRAAWLKMQEGIHGETFGPLNSENGAAKSAAPSFIESLRLAMGAPKTMKCGGREIRISSPRVKTLKALISKAGHLQETAAAGDGLGSMEQLQEIMLDCVRFTDKIEPPPDMNDWFDDLELEDGMNLVEAFTEVFDLRKLMAKGGALSGKK